MPFAISIPTAEGLHHCAFFCDDYAAERNVLVTSGLSVAREFTVSFGAQICYIDPSATLGHMLELCRRHPIIEVMYTETREAAENWDGKDLLRS